jgi:hypothetical protein
MLVYGNPGVGKTTLIGSGGKQFKTLIVRPPTDHPDNIVGSGVKEIVVRDWSDMLETQEYLAHEGSKWDWVWLDSISLYQDTGLDDVWEAAKERNPNRGKTDYLDKGEYRINMGRIGEWVRHCVGGGQFNFGITAHPFWLTVATDESPESAIDQMWPWIQGRNMPQKICGYMNVVGYMVHLKKTDKKAERRILYTNGNEFRIGKDDFNAIGNMIDPTMPKIMAAVNGKKAGSARTARPKRRTRTRTRAT